MDKNKIMSKMKYQKVWEPNFLHKKYTILNKTTLNIINKIQPITNISNNNVTYSFIINIHISPHTYHFFLDNI